MIGRQRSRARERIENPAKAKTVTVGKGQKGDAGAVFDLAPEVGSVSDKRAANGGVMACVKKAKNTTSMRRADGELPHTIAARRGWRGLCRVQGGASTMPDARYQVSRLACEFQNP
jgi:hypothetical protein